MIQLIVIAVIIAIAVGLLCIFLGRVVKSMNVPIAVTVGSFLEQFGWVLGVLAGIYYFATGGDLPW
jgi:predicted transporter